MIFVPGYWPYFKTHELRRFDYTAIDGSMPPLTAVFSYDPTTDSMLYADYNGEGVWRDTWFYQYRPGFGIAEWRDDYPGDKRVVMSPPIGWGEWATIGQTYTNSPKMDPLRSWPPSCAQGWQAVVFEALLDSFTTMNGTVYNNVLQFCYQQSWNGGKPAGARYWMALGVGPVAVQWVAQNDQGQVIETARMDAVVTSYNV